MNQKINYFNKILNLIKCVFNNIIINKLNNIMLIKLKLFNRKPKKFKFNYLYCNLINNKMKIQKKSKQFK